MNYPLNEKIDNDVYWFEKQYVILDDSIFNDFRLELLEQHVIALADCYM